MKSKKATYFLILLVVAVWSLIVLKVFNATGGDDSDDRPRSAIIALKEPYDDYEIKKDTAKLMLNYPDPFREINLATKAKVEKDNGFVKVTPVSKSQPMNWGFIKYSGFIRNPRSKELIALLTINGKTVLLKEGESIDKVKLLKNMQDSVKVFFDQKIGFIKQTRTL